MTRARVSFLVLVGLAVSANPQRMPDGRSAQANERAAAPLDSVVLERTGCLGPCPLYRVAIDSSNIAHFLSLDPDDSGRSESGPALPNALQHIFQLTMMIGFKALPDTIENSPLCGPFATDFPTAITGIYGRAITKQVVDYKGCRWTPGALTVLEDSIDALAASSRWVHTRWRTRRP